MKRVAPAMLPLLVLCGCRGNSEATAFAKQYWDQRMNKCGETYVVHNLNPNTSYLEIYECRSPRITALAADMTNEERIQGFEWIGGASLSCSSIRTKNSALDAFSDWEPGGVIDGARITRKNGDWDIKSNRLEKNPDCSLIAK
jgi:hypothetical protein